VSPSPRFASSLRSYAIYRSQRSGVLGYQILWGGHVSPYKDRRIRHRSLHFELYLASRAQASGICPQDEEPDIVVNHRGWRVGLAAKRINSPQKVATRFSEAAKQINQTKYPGIICADLSRIVFEKDHAILVSDYSDLYNLVNLIYYDKLRPLVNDAIARLPYPEQVLGVLLVTNTVGFDKVHNCPIDNMMRYCVLPENMCQKQKRRVSALIRCFYREDGSLSSDRTDKSLDHRYSETIQSPFG